MGAAVYNTSMKAILPIHFLIIFLVLLALSAIFAGSGIESAAWLKYVRNFAALFLGGYALSLIFKKILHTTPSRLEHRIITALILFLLFDAVFPWWVFGILGALTEALQRFVRTSSGPIFNPAALAALIFAVAGYSPGWWGMSFLQSIPLIPGDPKIALLLTVPLAGYVAYRYRKLPIVFSCLASFTLAYPFIFGGAPFLFLAEGAFVFFLLVMAVEPKTSPVAVKDQYVYGALIGLGIPLGMYVGAVDVLLVALLIANLYAARNFFLRHKIIATKDELVKNKLAI